MPSVAFWSAAGDNTWDGLVLSGPNGPMFTGKPTQEGVAKVKVSFGNDVEVKKPHGKDGATVTNRGQVAASVDITITMATEEQFQNFQTNVAPNLRAPAGKSPDEKGFGIVHPACALWGISSIIIQTVTGPDIDASGMGTVTIKCVENRPAKAGKGAITAKGTIPPFVNAAAGAPQIGPQKPSATPPKP